ncbi:MULTISPECIES: Holliday junction branch migration protein RuvA [unclassified Thermotoga]|uniref:Holliday junction branch migration protein RuvA n=1 Tax=unclassified Thermotoga TaxID=2631113 RepID=UPI0005440905|nr:MULTISPECIES: Holliday junction branch migration protein RuvA [unclassified Thermotoga]KAF2959341.1 Holliday junction ATP-dependent DNA helicase RuvA [Thermotoga sp. 38H-to]KHC93364.1 Holliday junction DNA helicase RuvA [Thermotoga sp. Mc24]
MIAGVSGRVLKKSGNVLLVETKSGVVFEIVCDVQTSEEVEEGKECFLHTFLSVSQDGITLYGFSNETKKELFLSLIKVSRLGPKTALKIISNEDAETLVAMIASQDVEGLSKLPGISKKTAERIVMELKDEFESAGIKDMRIYHESLEALVSLGYPEKQAREAVKHVYKEGMKTSELIKEALKFLSHR